MGDPRWRPQPEARREHQLLTKLAEQKKADAAAKRETLADLKLTPPPEPAPVFDWGILPDVFNWAWRPIWRLPPLAQRLVVGVILRTKPAERTGVSSIRVADPEVVRMTCGATRRQRPHRRGESIEAAMEAAIANRLFAGATGGIRDWGTVQGLGFDVIWPAGKWSTGPPIELRLLDQLGRQAQWRLMLAVLRLWWRPYTTFTPRKGPGGTWKDCPPESWPTVAAAVALAWERSLAGSPSTLRSQRRRGRRALAELVDLGMVRLGADRIMPSAEVRIARYDRPIVGRTAPDRGTKAPDRGTAAPDRGTAAPDRGTGSARSWDASGSLIRARERG